MQGGSVCTSAAARISSVSRDGVTMVTSVLSSSNNTCNVFRAPWALYVCVCVCVCTG